MNFCCELSTNVNIGSSIMQEIPSKTVHSESIMIIVLILSFLLSMMPYLYTKLIDWLKTHPLLIKISSNNSQNDEDNISSSNKFLFISHHKSWETIQTIEFDEITNKNTKFNKKVAKFVKQQLSLEEEDENLIQIKDANVSEIFFKYSSCTTLPSKNARILKSWKVKRSDRKWNSEDLTDIKSSLGLSKMIGAADVSLNTSTSSLNKRNPKKKISFADNVIYEFN